MIEKTVDAFGAQWTLVFDLDPDISAELAALWEQAGVEPVDHNLNGSGSTAAPRFVVGPHPPEGYGVQVTDPGPGTAYEVSGALTLASIERRAGQALLLHAAALCEPDGATVALVAGSGTGKTTAVTVLGRHLGYVTDETVAVEAHSPGHVVRSYPKPLSVIGDPAQPDEKHEHSPASLGLLSAAPSLHLRCLLLLERSSTPREPALEEVPLIDALTQLIPQTSSVLMLDRPLQRLAEVVTLAGPARALRYSEVADCVDLVHEALRHPVPAPPWKGEVGTVPPQAGFAETSEAATVDDPGLGVDSRVVRAPWRDAIHADDETLLIVDQVPVRLSALGALVWREARMPCRLGDVVGRAVVELGDHPDAEQLVLEAATAMVLAGVVLPVG